jgi:hypothetical protein
LVPLLVRVPVAVSSVPRRGSSIVGVASPAPFTICVVMSAAHRMLWFVPGTGVGSSPPSAVRTPTAHVSRPGSSGAMSPTIPRPVSLPVYAP